MVERGRARGIEPRERVGASVSIERVVGLVAREPCRPRDGGGDLVERAAVDPRPHTDARAEPLDAHAALEDAS